MRRSIFIIGVMSVLIVWMLYGFQDRDEVSKEESVKQMVQDKAFECYIMEGAYPSNIEYLIDNYGLLINTSDFIIDYNLIGQNVPPIIKVVATGG